MVSKMSREERAKQFMPFAALKGYPDALRRKEKVVLPKGKLSEDYQEELDRKLRQVHKNDIITVVYFCQNEYIKLTGIVNTKISFDDLYDITEISGESEKIL